MTEVLQGYRVKEIENHSPDFPSDNADWQNKGFYHGLDLAIDSATVFLRQTWFMINRIDKSGLVKMTYENDPVVSSSDNRFWENHESKLLGLVPLKIKTYRHISIRPEN